MILGLIILVGILAAVCIGLSVRVSRLEAQVETLNRIFGVKPDDEK